jgi:ligand-binding sensor domain-containing protein/signal transduction histidine kinase
MKSLALLFGRIAFLLTVSLFSAYSQPNRLQFKHLTPDDGLSSSTVTCILQDSKGFMWIGTYYGLNRYDGYHFIVYNNNSADATSLPHNLVWTLFEDSGKNLFIGTSAGLSMYDWQKDRFVNFMDDPSCPLSSYKNSVLHIDEDSLGNFWLATDRGLIYFDRKNNKAVHYTQEPGNPKSLSYYNVENVFIDSRNDVWVSTKKGLNLFHPETGTFEHVLKTQRPGQDISGVFFINIAEDHEGNLWFGSYGAGLFRLDAKNRTSRILINYRHDPRNDRSLSADRVHSLFIDRRGDVWVGAENGGLNCYDRRSDSFSHFRADELDQNSLNNESIYVIYEDHTCNFWIGTYAGGINISRSNGNAIFDFRKIPGSVTTLSHNSVTGFMHDHLGGIWIGTDGGGLNRFDAESGRFDRYNTQNSNLNSDAVLSIIEDSDQTIWLGTWAGGLNRFDAKSRSFKSFTTQNSGIADNNIHSIVEDKNGNLWMASFQNGLIRYQKKKNVFSHYSSKNINLNFISVVALAPDGRILVGTSSGFNIFNPKTCVFEKYFHVPENAKSISDNSVLSFAVENDTAVWIGTGNGLNRFNPGTGTFASFSSKNGLPDDVIKGIVFDDSGRLWVSTNKGLCRFNTKNGDCKNLTKSDGLQGNEFNMKSALKLHDGRLLFGGTNGFNMIYPERIIENRNVPRILITDFLIFNKPANIGVKGSPLKAQVSATDEITLSHKQSVFTFYFSAMDFTIPEKNQYAYIMEGFDQGWNFVGTQRMATYTNLGPGRYTFRVKGSNNDGVWNETGTSIRITITPPFWRRWWFQGGGLLFLAGLAFGSYKMRTARIRALNRDLERHVKERTAQLETTNRELEAFTYSVSHDLRAPLRGMAGFSQMLLEDYAGKIDDRGKDYLQRIQGASHRMGNLIDDLLKLSRLTRSEMHFSRVNLSGLVESIMREYQKAHPERRMTFTVAGGLMVQGDAPLLEVMLRNLVDNAWKFTSRTADANIEFDATQKDGATVYTLRDNGVGFDSAYSEKLFEVFQRQHVDFDGTGVGLATVRRVIHRHGGRIWAEGIVDKGAVFSFTLGHKP